jgi:hypothetical protein
MMIMERIPFIVVCRDKNSIFFKNIKAGFPVSTIVTKIVRLILEGVPGLVSARGSPGTQLYKPLGCTAS